MSQRFEERRRGLYQQRCLQHNPEKTKYHCSPESRFIVSYLRSMGLKVLLFIGYQFHIIILYTRRNPSTDDARRNEICVARRQQHVDASCDFYFIFSERAAWGGGMRCQTFYLLFFLHSATHARDWPLCVKVMFGLATNTLNARNNHDSFHPSLVCIKL